jgi:hypothetical protein
MGRRQIDFLSPLQIRICESERATRLNNPYNVNRFLSSYVPRLHKRAVRVGSPIRKFSV